LIGSGLRLRSTRGSPFGRLHGRDGLGTVLRHGGGGRGPPILTAEAWAALPPAPPATFGAAMLGYGACGLFGPSVYRVPINEITSSPAQDALVAPPDGHDDLGRTCGAKCYGGGSRSPWRAAMLIASPSHAVGALSGQAPARVDHT